MNESNVNLPLYGLSLKFLYSTEIWKDWTRNGIKIDLLKYSVVSLRSISFYSTP